jgi:hypothetical protein
MNKAVLFKWAIWMGVACAIFSFIYPLIPFQDKGIMWMSFTALAVYFAGGAKREEFPNYAASMIMGVVWGMIYLFFIGVLGKTGMNLSTNLAIVVGGVTIVVCAMHLVVTGNSWLNKVPMMFGATSLVFSQGGKNLLTLILTMFLGLVLALCCSEGEHLMEKWTAKE